MSLAILYGSFASGTNGPHSDIDVAVLKAINFAEDFLPALRMMQDARIRRFAHGR